METGVLKLSCGTETFDGQPNVADRLCRLLSCAPASYRRVRSVDRVPDCQHCSGWALGKSGSNSRVLHGQNDPQTLAQLRRT